MIAGVALGVLGLVVIVAGWSRFGPGRSQRHSVEEHQRALGVLGAVAKRRDGIAQVHPPSPGEIGRAHVHQTDEGELRFRRSRRPGGQVGPIPRIVLQSGPTPLRLPIFDDAKGRLTRAGASPGEPPASSKEPVEPAFHFDAFEGRRDSEAARRAQPTPSPAAAAPFDSVVRFDATPELFGSAPPDSPPVSKPSRSGLAGDPLLFRKVAAVAAVVVVLAAVGVGGWRLASNRSPSGHPSATPPNRGARHSTKGQPSKPNSSNSSGARGNSSVAHELAPTSTSPTLVTFPLSGSSFTITFSATAPCWIGVLPSQHGTYQWMTTVEAGTTTTYHANTPVFIRIGAPQYVRVKVDGIRLALPPHMIQPYDVTFSGGSSVSA